MSAESFNDDYDYNIWRVGFYRTKCWGYSPLSLIACLLPILRVILRVSTKRARSTPHRRCQHRTASCVNHWHCRECGPVWRDLIPGRSEQGPCNQLKLQSKLKTTWTGQKSARVCTSYLHRSAASSTNATPSPLGPSGPKLKAAVPQGCEA